MAICKAKKEAFASITGSISRNAGGLFWAMRSLNAGLMRRGAAVHVFGSEDEHTADDFAAWDPTPVSTFSVVGPRAFGYQVGLSGAIRAMSPALIHVHGLWMYPSCVAIEFARAKVPYMVSPHGMLDSWALNNSSWKKSIAARLYEDRHLRGAACIHALCHEEYLAVRNYGLTNPVAIIPNGVDLPALKAAEVLPTWCAEIPSDAKVLLFLSRIHPKKGLSILLEAWADVAAKGGGSTKGWHLVVAGWDQGGHQRDLAAIVAAHGIGQSVHFVGPQFGADKQASFQRASAFVLPSMSEGLPMAVLEAWAYAKPVVMTPECNLPIGFEVGAAVRVESNTASIAGGLLSLFSMSEADLDVMGASGRRLAEDVFDWNVVSEKMLDVYRWCVSGGDRPDCIYEE